MITISVNNDYGIQTGDFDVTFTAIRSNGDVMDYVAVIGDEEIEGTVTSGEETSFNVSNFENLISVNNTIALTVSYNADVATVYVTFMKFRPPVIIPKYGDFAGAITAAGTFYINVKDILSPINSGWDNIVGVISWGFYLDQVDEQHRVPLIGDSALGQKQVSAGEVVNEYITIDSSQISEGEHFVYCVVSMIRSGYSSTFNADDPWKYDNYLLIQKTVRAEKISGGFNWITPKTNWVKGEGLEHTDYNRIKNNLLYLHNSVNSKFTPFDFPNLGNNKTITDYYYADEFNALEDELETINEHSVNFDIGVKAIFYQLGKFIGYVERNRIEQATLDLRNYVQYAIPIPYLIAPLVYSGQRLTPKFFGVGGYQMSGDTSGLEVGTYSTVFTLSNDNLYWVDGTTDPITLEWTIEPCPVYVPTVSGNYVYNGYNQNVSFDTYNTQAITLTGELSGKNVGTYTVTASLSDNYVWVDGTTEDKTIEWNIATRVFAIPYITPYEYIYSGNSYHIANEDIENYLTWAMQRSDSGSEYKVDAGTYTFDISLRDTANNAWLDGTTAPITLSWTIQKANGHVTLDQYSVLLNFSVREIYVYASDVTGAITATSRNSNIVSVDSVQGSSSVAIRLVTGTTSGNTIIDVNVAESNNYKATSAQIQAEFSKSVENLAGARSGVTGASGMFAYVAGGYDGANYSNIVDIYGASLWHSVLTPLTVSRAYMASAYDYYNVIFAGGTDGTPTNKSELYTEGRKVNISDLSVARSMPTGIYNGYYFMFAGGSTSTGSSKRVDIYDNSMTLSYSDATDLNISKRFLASAQTQDYVLIGGGDKGTSYTNEVEAYNSSSLTKVPCPTLNRNTAYMSGGDIGNYAVFVAGQNNDSWGSYSNSVECYDNSLTKHLPSAYPNELTKRPGVIQAGHYLFVAGGETSNGVSKGAYAYDGSLTRYIAADLSKGRANLAAVCAGDYAIFAGGQTISQLEYFDSVEIYNQDLQHDL